MWLDGTVKFPDPLRRRIDEMVRRAPGPEVARAAAEISEAYRKSEFASAPLKSAAHRLAYLQVRMPATYAACAHVFEHTREVMPQFAPASLLDLGAGPGTVAWAALEHFPSLQAVSLVERDAELVRIGKALAAESSLRDARWSVGDLRTLAPQPHDLIVISYALGELQAHEMQRLVRTAWQAARLLILIEPGTPKAFARMAELRKQLIGDGATIAAPCPHERECPLYAKADWCHFSERLERTAEHRRMKGGSLGYEDEKFSYIAATRLPIVERMGRIVRHPRIHSGYVQLQVCATDSLEQKTVTKSQKETYRAARKARWGDRWPS
jgi:ribosomal protein RSM22 (predicted rRNA methylase)